MKRYSPTATDSHIVVMEEDASGEYVKFADVIGFLLDVEGGRCTTCHARKDTTGGLLCSPCRAKACLGETTA